MGFGKWVKKVAKKVGGQVKRSAKQVGRAAGKYVSGGMWNPGSGGGGDDMDYRSAAASKQIKDVKRQAGAGQIEYRSEEDAY